MATEKTKHNPKQSENLFQIKNFTPIAELVKPLVLE